MLTPPYSSSEDSPSQSRKYMRAGFPVTFAEFHESLSRRLDTEAAPLWRGRSRPGPAKRLAKHDQLQGKARFNSTTNHRSGVSATCTNGSRTAFRFRNSNLSPRRSRRKINGPNLWLQRHATPEAARQKREGAGASFEWGRMEWTVKAILIRGVRWFPNKTRH
jgi:hypothetical protein